ncbi:hypothetical protein [Orrella sp. 11846]|uniref:hypothetical protein n=1 Tax=Orrella sp. 11846 TaxID=3409913 RepID=UPI003B5AF1DB
MTWAQVFFLSATIIMTQYLSYRGARRAALSMLGLTLILAIVGFLLDIFVKPTSNKTEYIFEYHCDSVTHKIDWRDTQA